MKRPFLSIWVFVLQFGLLVSANAQLPQCVSRIQNRIDTLRAAGDANFDFFQARQIAKKFDFGETTAFVNNPDAREAFKRIYTSMSEFLDLAPTNISGSALKGYTKFSGVMIRQGDYIVTELNISHLKEAFTKGGFRGKNFDDVMNQLGDDGQFDFDAGTRIFESKSSGLKYTDHPAGAYGAPGRETNSINHVLRGHLDNDFQPTKSKFKNASDVFNLIDDAYNQFKVARQASGNATSNLTGIVRWRNGPNNSWTIEVSQGATTIGTRSENIIRIAVRKNDEGLHTAFPVSSNSIN